MGRVLVVLIAFALVIKPEIRAAAKPYADRLLAPAYEWTARARAAEIARAIETRVAAGHPSPTAVVLSEFIARHYGHEAAAFDPWGNPYFLTADAFSLQVASAGRDGVPETPDDLLSQRIPRSVF